MSRWGTLALAMGMAAVSTPVLAARRVAVVISLADVPSLPAGTELPVSQESAKYLADILEKRGGYERVEALFDSAATRDAVQALLLQRIPKDLHPGDTLLVAFSGQGFGGDFDDPHLLLYDSAVDQASSALNLYDLSSELTKSLQGVNLILLLDASHAGAANGVALLGPTAKSLTGLIGSVYVLTATSPGETAPDGLFFRVVGEGLKGAADANHDAAVSASELRRYTVDQVGAQSHYKTHPDEAGTYDANLVVASVSGRRSKDAGAGPAKVPSEGAGHASAHRFGGPVSFSLMGAGAVVAGGLGVFGNLRGHALCPVVDGLAHCPDDDVQSRYDTLRGLTLGGYVCGAALGAVGIGLAFVPLSDEAWIHVGARF